MPLSQGSEQVSLVSLQQSSFSPQKVIIRYTNSYPRVYHIKGPLALLQSFRAESTLPPDRPPLHEQRGFEKGPDFVLNDSASTCR